MQTSGHWSDLVVLNLWPSSLSLLSAGIIGLHHPAWPKHRFFFFIIVLGGGTLQHLQKFYNISNI
jgi:hypothetical protein